MSITNVITRITVDMAGDVKRFAVKAKQYDRATRVIVVSLLWDEVPYVLDSADTVRCNVHKPDGTIAIIEGDNIAVNGNTVTITLPGTALTAAGRAWADIEIETQDESQQVSCQCFEIDIAKSPVDDDSIISTNEFSAMKLATKAANDAAAAATAEIEATAAAGTAASQAAAAAQAATDAANQAAAAATASIQIDPTLTDNSKAAPAGMVGEIKEDLSEKASVSSVDDYVLLDIESGGSTQRYSVPSQSAFDDLKAQVESSGLTVRIKRALMQLANYAVFKNNDPNAKDYIDELYNSLFEIVGIRLNSSSLSFTSLGATQQLTATTTPEGGNVVWTSSDTSIATVDQTGLVTSVAYGSATITATSGSVSASCPVVIATATVTSLSAVYSPSSNVYEGASLDSLKSDLVVTAHWSNGTTATVSGTDYSLIGTLVEGTNTIAVAYGGQTTTFNVTVLPVPEYGTFTPDNYVQGYYIENDGTVTASQYGSMSETYYDAVWKSLKFTSSVDFRLSFYDRDKTFLQQVVFNTINRGYDAIIKAHSGIVSVPDDAKYFRLSWSSTNNVEFTVENETYENLAMVIGDIDVETGLDETEPKRIRSVDYLPVSGATLQVENYRPFRKSAFGTHRTDEYNLMFRCYDSSKVLVGSVSTKEDNTLTLPTNTAFIRLIIQLGSFNIPNDFVDYIYMPLTLNSENYVIVGG